MINTIFAAAFGLMVAFFGASVAAAPIAEAEINQVNQWTAVSLSPGFYETRMIGGSWNAWGQTDGCEPDGSDCTRGWLSFFYLDVNGIETTVSTGGRYRTPQLALENPASTSFEVAFGDTVRVAILDAMPGDNSYAFPVTIGFFEAAAEVPGPAAPVALFLVGLAIASRRLLR